MMQVAFTNVDNDIYDLVLVSVNYVYAEDLKLYIQDTLGAWYCVFGFPSSTAIIQCMWSLFRAGYYDFTEFHVESYDNGGDD